VFVEGSNSKMNISLLENGRELLADGGREIGSGVREL